MRSRDDLSHMDSIYGAYSVAKEYAIGSHISTILRRLLPRELKSSLLYRQS